MFTADENIKNTNHNTTVVSHGTSDLWIEQGLTSPPTQAIITQARITYSCQNRLYGRRFLQVTRRNQQYQSTEGTQRLHRRNTI